MKPENSPEMTAPAQKDAGEKKTKFRRPSVFVVGIIVLTGVLFWLAGWMIESFTHESTDDAFLDAHVVTVAPKVAGLVSAIHIKQNQFVKKGDPLLEIDPRDFETKLAQKRAAEAASEANAKTVRASFELIRARVVTAEASAKQVSAEVTAAEATQQKASSDLQRNEDLRKRNVISPQEFDAVKTAADAAVANLRAAREKLAGAKAQLEAAKSVIEVSGAQLKQAKADVTAADLDLSYSHIVSPIDGRITNKKVEAGDYLQIGQALFALVPNELWVTANFKETQLKKVHPDQTVEISIDSIADKTFRGHVESVQSGSGARFSLLPPENAVGNFVKVVQRVPVKIVFDEPLNHPQTLGPGMSVVPSVRTSDFHVSSVLVVAVSLVLAILAAWLVWFLTDPRRKA